MSLNTPREGAYNQNHRCRVAFLLPGVGIVNRGAEAFVLELSQRLGEHFDVTILSRGVAKNLGVQISAIPHDLPFLSRIYRRRVVRKIADKLFLDAAGIESLSFSLHAVPYLLGANYDFLIPINGIWGAWVCRVIRRLRGTPFITVGHAGIGRPDLWQARQHPDMHIVLTEHARKWITKCCSSLNVRVISDGIDLQRYHPNTDPVLTNLECPVYLCAAALVPYKNIHLTIEAVSRLERGSLIVLGAGALRAELESQGLRQLGPGRFLLKAVPYRDMPSYFAACDAFTLVSEKECEAFGIVYLEAMASNKPVVATADPIREEVIGEAGILCDGHDVDAYANALRSVVSTDFGDKPRRQAEKFAWDSMALQYQQLIIEVCQQARTTWRRTSCVSA